MKVNEYQPDPIQNRRMSDACWDGKHFGQSVMIKDSDGVKRRYDIGCRGWLDKDDSRKSPVHCGCLCHDPQPAAPPKTSRKEQANATMDIMESGYGTIEVK